MPDKFNIEQAIYNKSNDLDALYYYYLSLKNNNNPNVPTSRILCEKFHVDYGTRANEIAGFIDELIEEINRLNNVLNK